MNRKQAQATGGRIYKEWMAGYDWMKYHGANMNRQEYSTAAKSFIIGINSPSSLPDTKAYLWGMYACVQYFLKKGKYHVCTCKCTCR